MADLVKHIDIYNPLTNQIDSRDIGADGSKIDIPYDNKDMVIKTTESSDVQYTKALVDALRDYAPIIEISQEDYDNLPNYKSYDDKIYLIDEDYENIKAQNILYNNVRTGIKAGTVQTAIDLLVQYVLTGNTNGMVTGVSIVPAVFPLDGNEEPIVINAPSDANMFLCYTVDRDVDTDSGIIIPNVKSKVTLKGDNGISKRVEASYEGGTFTINDNGNICDFYYVAISSAGNESSGGGGGGSIITGSLNVTVDNHTLKFTKSTSSLRMAE